MAARPQPPRNEQNEKDLQSAIEKADPDQKSTGAQVRNAGKENA